MTLLAFKRMWERIETARTDSDTNLFVCLMYFGELLTKTVCAGIIATIADDKNRNRYCQVHRAVRADGIGEWASIIDNVLVGPPAQFLMLPDEDKRELTQAMPTGSWQHEANSIIYEAINKIDPNRERMPVKVTARRWFGEFAYFRNKTRGHGATPTSKYSEICPLLEKSINIMIENIQLLNKPWVYLHRNLSGKYRITKLSESSFLIGKNLTGLNLQDGVYFEMLEKPHYVELISSDVDASDFFYPNGGFKDKNFEMLSYISGNTKMGDATPYLVPANDLPASETQSVGILDVQGNCFGNLPSPPVNYINRNTLETELTNVLTNDRHPVVTLVGRGGIGKTSLALSVLHSISQQNRYGAIIWFSARDIDLLTEGPKLVKPQILNIDDVAKEFVQLMQPEGYSKREFKPVDYLSSALGKSPLNEPVLFVFDNFETVSNPAELYTWLDTYIRLPNKVLITTRIRDFKGDYPVEVSGMNDQEVEKLIDSTAKSLGIYYILSPQYRQELLGESDGHPYVIKMLLGEVAKAGNLVKIERIVANRDEILNALFERTYSSISPGAKRVFLTLCNWRSVIPQVAVEAVLLRPANEIIDVAKGIEELVRSSFIELTVSEKDNTAFLSVPLVASVFGRSKLSVSPMKGSVEADTQLLHDFGAAQRSDVKHGMRPRVERLFRNIAVNISQQKLTIDEALPILEFIASKHPNAWRLLASLHEEVESEKGMEKAKTALSRYLESSILEEDKLNTWYEIASLCQRTDDWEGEVNALLNACVNPIVPYEFISNSANRINRYIAQNPASWGPEEKDFIISQIADVMEKRIDEGTGNDCSRLAWLYTHLKNESKAKEITRKGLSLDPENIHCLKLAERFQIND